MQYTLVNKVQTAQNGNHWTLASDCLPVTSATDCRRDFPFGCGRSFAPFIFAA